MGVGCDLRALASPFLIQAVLRRSGVVNALASVPGSKLLVACMLAGGGLRFTSVLWLALGWLGTH